jgi:hypothetical protein
MKLLEKKRNRWFIFVISFIVFAGIAGIFYKFSSHHETNIVDGERYQAYWKGGKVYKLEISKKGAAKPTSMFLYSRKNVRFLATPQLKWHPHPTIADEFFIDTNGDGKWDVYGKWNYPDGGYKVQQDTDYDGIFDKEYKISGIM